MAWKNCVALPAIVLRRRVVASALVYGLSLSVRFTSASGEQVEIPSLTTTSIMKRDDTPSSNNGWPLRPTEPIALQLGWPLVPRLCHTACERPAHAALMTNCDAP
jgi:hypothetical protein